MTSAFSGKSSSSREKNGAALSRVRVYMSKGCADIYNPKTIQSSQGALFYIPVIQTDLVEEIKKLQERNIEVYATALHDNHKDLQDIKPSEKYAILVGNEGQGVRKELID